jgi:DNA-binding CsgD family transcriptional regulator
MVPPSEEDVGFTARELDVLRLIARGMSSDEIASALFLSPHTVSGYRKSLFAKLGVHSQVQAVVQGAARGLIELPDVPSVGAERRDGGADGHEGEVPGDR